MNTTHVDIITSPGTLTGDNFEYNGKPRRWTKIFAHSAASVTITSDTMTEDDGITPAVGVTLAIPAGETFCGFFKVITLVSGVVSCTRLEGL